MDDSGSLLACILVADVDEDVLRAMRVPQRRYALYHLLDVEKTTMDELTAEVGGWMTAVHSDVGQREDTDRLRTALYHRHLPVLSGAGLVEFDHGDEVVVPTFGPDARELVEASYIVEHSTPGEAA